MGLVRLTRAIEFSASLTFRRGDLSAEENARVFGPNSARHGHNYRLEVTLRGEPDAVTGMVIDLKELQAVLDREIMERFEVKNQVARGFNKDGRLVAEVPLTELLQVRPAYDERRDVYRLDVT